MIELPKKCYVNKFIPKKVFYEKVGVSSGIKEEFINLVDKITWLYKLSQDTTGITKTKNVEEIQIFQIDIKYKKVPLSVMKTIAKGVQYKVLFVIKYNDEYCYAIRVEDFYLSDWNDDINFTFDAINLEVVYENIVKTILKEKDNNNQFQTIIKNSNEKLLLERMINQLKQKIKTEKQFNRKTEMNIELNKLLKELEDLENE